MIRSASPLTPIPRTLSVLLPPRLLESILRLSHIAPEELHLYDGRAATVRAGGRVYSTDAVLNAAEISAILRGMCSDSLYAYAVFASEALGCLDDLFRNVLIERDLRDPRLISEIHEDQSAEAPRLSDPAVEHYILTFIGKPELATHVSSFIKHLPNPPFLL